MPETYGSPVFGWMYGLYQKSLRRRLKPDVVPHHVAMIIDGNRRWAKQLGLASPADGHRAGAVKVAEFLEWCDEVGVAVVTLYLLSSDNLSNRRSEELDDLVQIIADLAANVSTHRDWKVKHVGSMADLPTHLVTALRTAERQSAGAPGMHVNMAVGYGGRSEIVDAIRSIVTSHGETGGTIESLADQLTPELIGEHLYTSGQPDPDLVIRTSGEQRLSDFMVWQSAHSEFYFVDALGPDLREVDFLRALRDYAGRQRRFGS